MKRRAICSGTFDPITNSHLDIIKRSRRIFDEIIVAVTTNPSKNPLFSIEERVAQVKDAVKNLDNVSVESFDGLLVNYVVKKKAVAIVRGLRAVSDFEYELQMALMNRRLSQGIVETVFMMPPEEYSFLSSTMVKEVASFKGPVKGLVPRKVTEALRRKFRK